jgi:hypothetical protein
MRYDLNLLHARCREVGLPSTLRSDERLEIALRSGVLLCFLNSEREEDCLVGFEGTPWHTHGDFTFSDAHGCYVEMSYLDVLNGLAGGQVLVVELWRDGTVSDRWLIHRDYNELRHLEEGEEIRVFRPVPPP